MFADILKKAKDPEDTVMATQSLCAQCIWMDRMSGIKCDAFPNGIPLEILLGVFDHHYHYDQNGTDDGGLVFTSDVTE